MQGEVAQLLWCLIVLADKVGKMSQEGDFKAVDVVFGRDGLQARVDQMALRHSSQAAIAH